MMFQKLKNMNPINPMNNMAGVNLLGKRGGELQDMSVLLMFLCDLNMNHTSVESLFLLS